MLGFHLISEYGEISEMKKEEENAEKKDAQPCSRTGVVLVPNRTVIKGDKEKILTGATWSLSL